VVTALVTAQKLSYVEPGEYWVLYAASVALPWRMFIQATLWIGAMTRLLVMASATAGEETATPA